MAALRGSLKCKHVAMTEITVRHWDIKRHTGGGTDQEHPPLPLEEVMSVSDASLDLIAPLSVCVVYVSSALQQHVGHQEQKRAQLLFFHLHDARDILLMAVRKKKRTASVLLLQLLALHDNACVLPLSSCVSLILGAAICCRRISNYFHGRNLYLVQI